MWYLFLFMALLYSLLMKVTIVLVLKIIHFHPSDYFGFIIVEQKKA